MAADVDAPTAADSLAPLLDLPDVRTALRDARAAVDHALRQPALRRSGCRAGTRRPR